MVNGNKVVVVLPAYNAAKTLEKTYAEIPFEVVDEVLLCDDASHDETMDVARQLRIQCCRHWCNLGYGGNQKTCYTEALKLDADVVVMLHPDYQYPPRLIPDLVRLVAGGRCDVALGSRILGGGALEGGMPLYKYAANRVLTLVQNCLLGVGLSEYHTGFRAFSRRVLETLPLLENSDDFLFDNQMLAQAIFFGFSVGEVPCPTRYFPEASSINFTRSVKYGLGVLLTSVMFVLNKLGWCRSPVFSRRGQRIHADLKRPAMAGD